MKNFVLIERIKGIEPSSSGWKPDVIAVIRYTRYFKYLDYVKPKKSLS